MVTTKVYVYLLNVLALEGTFFYCYMHDSLCNVPKQPVSRNQ